MDYHINGIDYLVLDNKNNKSGKKSNNTYNNNSFEFEMLKNWLVFKKEPINQKQIENISIKMEYVLNHKIHGWNYEDVNENNEKINLLNLKFSDIQTLKIPENYLRFQKLLDINYDEI